MINFRVLLSSLKTTLSFTNFKIFYKKRDLQLQLNIILLTSTFFLLETFKPIRQNYKH